MKVGIRELPEDLERIAKKELGEDPKRRNDDIEHIKNWIVKQPHLKINLDDQWILTFLRGCKFSLERTKEKLDSYYSMRSVLPEFFTNRDPLLPELQEILKLGICFPLPHADPKGRKLFLFRVGQYDPSKIKLLDILKLNYINMDVVLREDDRAIVCGDINIIDLKGVTLAHAAQLNPSLLKKSTTCYQESYPVRPQGIHYINVPPYFETTYNLIKSFLKDKLRKRLHVHGSDMNSLYKEVPQKCLPNEYGGQAGTIDELAAAWKRKIESCRDWLIEDEKKRSDESKRPGKPKTQEALFGIEGSFRSLSVD